MSRHATDGQFNPVTEEEFLNISDLVRGRSKLTDVNLVCFAKKMTLVFLLSVTIYGNVKYTKYT